MRLTRGRAIRLFCLECMGYDKHRSGSTHSVSRMEAAYQVKDCTDLECPLYNYRTGTETGGNRPRRAPKSPQKSERSTPRSV